MEVLREQSALITRLNDKINQQREMMGRQCQTICDLEDELVEKNRQLEINELVVKTYVGSPKVVYEQYEEPSESDEEEELSDDDDEVEDLDTNRRLPSSPMGSTIDDLPIYIPSASHAAYFKEKNDLFMKKIERLQQVAEEQKREQKRVLQAAIDRKKKEELAKKRKRRDVAEGNWERFKIRRK